MSLTTMPWILKQPHWFTHTMRFAFLFLFLLVSLTFQVTNSQFFTPFVFMFVYGLLSIGLSLSIFLIDQKKKDSAIYNTIVFSFDVFMASVLFYQFSGLSFFFPLIYYMTILICGLLYKQKGAFLLTFFIAAVFNFLLILKNEPITTSFYLFMISNNLIFFSLAGLSGFLGSQLDIAQDKVQKQSDKIQSLFDFNKTIVENASMGFMTISEKGQIQSCNEYGMEILGAQHIVNKPLKTFFPQLDMLIQSKKVIRLTKNKKIDLDYKIFNEKKKLDCFLSPIDAVDKSSPQGYVLVFQDLTEVKRLEKRLQENEKMAAIGRLSAGIAHEIRNPLASISGSLQMLSESDEKGGKLINIALKEISRLNGLVTEFLDYANPNDMEKKEKVSLKKLIKDVLEVVRLNKNLNSHVFQNVKIEESIEVSGNYNKLKQALLNIVINAYQAMENVEDAEILIQTYEKSGQKMLLIRDNGYGISPENVKKVFEPFHTTKPKGSGLGLAITHKILKNHNIEISVESEIEKGTSFYFVFLDKKSDSIHFLSN